VDGFLMWFAATIPYGGSSPGAGAIQHIKTGPCTAAKKVSLLFRSPRLDRRIVRSCSGNEALADRQFEAHSRAGEPGTASLPGRAMAI